MSANNQLVVIKYGREYEVYEHHCVDNDFDPGEATLLFKETSLKRAIQKANLYCVSNIVEYGVHVEV